MSFHLPISWPPSRYEPGHRAGALPETTHGRACQVTEMIGPTREDNGAVASEDLKSLLISLGSQGQTTAISTGDD